MTIKELDRLRQAEVLLAFKKDVLSLKETFQKSSKQSARYVFVEIGTMMSNRSDSDGKTLTKLNYKEISNINDILTQATNLYLLWVLDEIERQFKEL